MASQKYEFKVHMACEGCSGAVTKVLTRSPGVESVKIDMENQKVLVSSSLPSDEVLTIIKKTGKQCSLVQSD
ncbi:copper transport protein ATOX1 homolog [Saccoglossus kowalevskii]